MTVPLYSYENEFQGYIPERYALKLEREGVALLVRQKGGVRKGAIRRARLYRRPGDPKPSTLRDHMGKAYSWKQPLDDGHQPWALRPLVGHVARNDQSHECHLAPASLRPIFIRVLLDCLSTRAAA